jgi:Ion channel
MSRSLSHETVLASKQERLKRRQNRLGGRMTKHIEQIDILLPLSIGACTVLCTILIHALALGATVNFFRHEKKLGRAGAGVFVNFSIAVFVISIAFAAHLLEIGLWAVLFVALGEFQEFGTAFYHSAVNYTTLGYGDLLLTPSWRLLGPLEAANGALMFGVSTAMVFAVTQRLILARYQDLRN